MQVCLQSFSLSQSVLDLIGAVHQAAQRRAQHAGVLQDAWLWLHLFTRAVAP